MKRIRSNSHRINSNKNEVVQGFRVQDQWYLKNYDNSIKEPQIQLFTAEDLEEENPEDRKYFCAVCKSRLDYHKYLHIWICGECQEQYDLEYLQDVPIKDPNDSIIRPYQEHYAQFNENDPNILFVEGINLDSLTGESEDVQLVRTLDNNRIQHIRVRGSPVKALAAMNEMDGK